jgi:hypothetical protein
MILRFNLAEALLKLNTRVAVQAADDHFMDILRLNRSDNMGERSQVTFCMLRLGHDQACYDLIKWYETAGARDFDWGNTDLPLLDIKDANVFEPVDIFVRAFVDFENVVAITLLKIRMLKGSKAAAEVQHRGREGFARAARQHLWGACLLDDS